MNRIKELREKKRITQARLGMEIDVSQESISLYENDRTMLQADILCRLADYFNVSTDYLLQRTDSKRSLAYSELDSIEVELVLEFRKLQEKSKYKVIGYIHGLSQN